jgi:hypothetical protein
MTRAQKSLALLAALLAVVVVIAAVMRSRAAELTLRFAGREPDGVAEFIFENRSSRTVLLDRTFSAFKPPRTASERLSRMHNTRLETIPPGSNAHLRFIPPREATWRPHVAVYHSGDPLIRVRKWLTKAGVPPPAAYQLEIIYGDMITNAPPVP